MSAITQQFFASDKAIREFRYLKWSMFAGLAFGIVYVLYVYKSHAMFTVTFIGVSVFWWAILFMLLLDFAVLKSMSQVIQQDKPLVTINAREIYLIRHLHPISWNEVEKIAVSRQLKGTEELMIVTKSIGKQKPKKNFWTSESENIIRFSFAVLDQNDATNIKELITLQQVRFGFEWINPPTA